ncbi:PREDICTED: deformed epidermal autoregulatory factor 1 homolog [Priapulus caudatus]|uniref:Deformed epidermal autoregulatory factor 1 homolog n=1 Tax=Priapulus caudatus TaxID=37621 RepID=A0ABM1DXX9_PRICU|nr:PREDICTED: deformed epidermal autoregulatory factor 1 homolog [Priapulus caudatus]
MLNNTGFFMQSRMDTKFNKMSEVELAEVIPSSDDSAFVTPEDQEEDDQQQAVAQLQAAAATAAAAANQVPVYVATADGYLVTEQIDESGPRTTHIVIHDQTLEESLKTPVTPITPLTPATEKAEGKFKYQWDDSVNLPVLPVRCKNTNGEMHKIRFGSGGRGRCIKMGDNWYTPSEFEAVSGRASSKDWKRSIRYGGRSLQCLIEENILQPHATSCTCAACCDDETVTGPVRLFTPYKRRKYSTTVCDGVTQVSKKEVHSSLAKVDGQSLTKDSVMVFTPTSSIRGTLTSEPQTIHVVTSSNGIVETHTGSEAGTMIMTPMQTSPATPVSARHNGTVEDMDEDKIWWQLEEVATSVIQQAQQLKHLITQSRQHFMNETEEAMHDLRNQLENEKKEALNTARIEAQMNLSRAVMEARAEKEIAVQQALARARAENSDKLESLTDDDSSLHHKSENLMPKQCANCNRDSYLECTGCRRVSYCSAFCQQKDWVSHQSVCLMVEDEDLDSDREKE